jgi:hypothetical protein
MTCPGTWPIDRLYEWQVTHGELACTRVKGHIGLCEASDPDTGRTFQFPGLMTGRKR